MAQADWNMASNLSGTQYRVQDTADKQALGTSHKGPSRPSYAEAGTVWIDDSANPTWTIKMYDGADDITLGSFNTTTNIYFPSKAALQDGSRNYAADAGSTDAYAITLNPAITAYTTGMIVVFKANTANTGAATLNINSVGAKALKKPGGSDVETGEIVSGQFIEVVYNGTDFTIISPLTDTSSSSTVPTKYKELGAPQYVTASTFSVSHFTVEDSTGTKVIEKTTTTTVDITTSGVNGLDTGSEASDTWYYLYAILDDSDANPALILSTVNEFVTGTITLPSGYTSGSKRQLPFMVRNDGSSNFIQWQVTQWPHRAKIMLQKSMTYYEGGFQVSDLNVLSAGTATSLTDVDLSSFVPPLSEYVHLHAVTLGADFNFQVKNKGSAGDIQALTSGITGSSTNDGETHTLEIGCDTSQVVQYKKVGGQSLYLDVMGWTITEDL